MKKFILQFLTILGAFLLLWILLSQINFKGIIQLEKRLKSAENKLGELILKAFEREYRLIENNEAQKYIENLASRIIDANDISGSSIDIYLMRSKDVNAFALPGQKIVILSGLIDFCETPEELAGVLAHEIAHIESNHVVKKLSKEIGIGITFALITGNYGSEIAKSLLKILTSTAYDRSLEREADRLAITYMKNADIDPRAYINILIRFGEELTKLPKEFQWISTHPDSAERARELKTILEEWEETAFTPMDTVAWEAFRELF